MRLLLSVKWNHIHEFVQIIEVTDRFEDQRFNVSAYAVQAQLCSEMIQHVLKLKFIY